MSITARPVVVRPHHAFDSEQKQASSPLIVDDPPVRPEHISDFEELGEEGEDIPLQADDDAYGGERAEEMTRYDLDDDIDADHTDAEVEDTPGDDATIAAARIERFEDAHQGTAPVDVGPFLEKNRSR